GPPDPPARHAAPRPRGAAVSRAITLAAAVAALLVAAPATAGELDELGRYVADPGAVAFEDFRLPTGVFPPDGSPECEGQIHWRTELRPDALSGDDLLILDGADRCPERFVVDVPEEVASYRATVWMRHGSIGARMFVWYPPEAGRDGVPVRM